MKTNTNIFSSWRIQISIICVWLINCVLAGILAIQYVWLPYIDARANNYQNISADPFDGTILPITHIPNWNKVDYKNKNLHFQEVSMNNLMPIPLYEPQALLNPNNVIIRLTYTVPYMGSYSLNYKENDGSHLGVDIRAPIGTPVLSIANGVVVKVTNGDVTGNHLVIIRHDNVPVNGKNTTLYSAYLHLSEITAIEGTKIRKWEMLWKVGSTGISTAPHLHFQIDTEDAPFHPYWPFTSTEARKAGMNMFQAVTAGLGREKAAQYTINPLIFVQHYLSGNNNSYNETKPVPQPEKTLEEIVNFVEVPETADTPLEGLENLVSFNSAPIVASKIAYNPNYCRQINTANTNMQDVQNKYCTFEHFSEINENTPVSRGDALISIMKFYNEQPKNEMSPYLDISLADSFLQGYASVASEKWIFKSSYLNPHGNLTKAEFIEILARFGKLKTRPKNVITYNDITKNSTLYNSVQNYGYTIWAKNTKIFPNKTLTQKDLAEILSKL